MIFLLFLDWPKRLNVNNVFNKSKPFFLYDTTDLSRNLKQTYISLFFFRLQATLVLSYAVCAGEFLLLLRNNSPTKTANTIEAQSNSDIR